MDEEKNNTGIPEDATKRLTPIEPTPEVPKEEIPEGVTPVEEVPTEEVPTEEVPAEEVPVEEVPEEGIPAEEISAEEDPMEEAPVEEIPVEEAPETPPLDGVRLACELCEAVTAAVGKDGFHGGIRPDNISVGEQGVTLGNPLEHGVGEFTPQELEYMAPELFWDGVRGPSGDVYSIGLVLYCMYNHGRMPFWNTEGDSSPNLRAAALQKRMNKEEIPAPVAAGEELGGIIRRALAFSVEERWHDAEELRNALGDCQEEQNGPADLAQIVAAMNARGKAPARKPEPKKKEGVDSPFVGEIREEPLPKVKVRRTNRHLAQIIVYAVLALAIVAVIFLLRRCVALDEAAQATPTPPVATTLSPADEEKIINGNQSDASATPAPTEEPDAAATPEPTPAPTVFEYVAFKEDVSWSQAVARCEELGGELAMPIDYAEFQEITAACEEQGLTFVWLNAHRDAEGNWVDSNGNTAAFFFAWGDGEPSKTDASDGVAEDYFLLWSVNGRWSGNDSRENPLDGFRASYTGRIGFVCKRPVFENAAGAEVTE